MMVPAVAEADRALTPEDLEVPPEVRRSVAAYLRERCPLTTELVVAEPAYRWISVRARLIVRAQPAYDEGGEDTPWPP